MRRIAVVLGKERKNEFFEHIGFQVFKSPLGGHVAQVEAG
jgi:hypothetical protein